MVAVHLVGVDVRPKLFGAVLILALLLPTHGSQAQVEPPADSGVSPATTHTDSGNPTVRDRGSDAGGAIEISWDEWLKGVPADRVTGFEVLRSTDPEGEFAEVGTVDGTQRSFVDATTKDGMRYFYIVVAKLEGLHPFISETLGPVQSSAQWFNWARLNQFLIGAIISGSIIFFIAVARAGRKLFVRKIAGLEAVDEAIGRATELGRPILFIPGIQDMDNVQTIAGLTILSRVAKSVAEYDTRLNVPVSRSLVMTTARESMKEAYLAAGRPDAYSDDMVHYLTDEQFGYVAAVDGIMVRQKPATCFYMGAFYAESLIMAETGNDIGAIQIAGTAQPAQLPFFVAACDYTLIGEELFAASAYLSGEPKQLGSMKGQDVGKGIGMIAIVVGTACLTFASLIPGLGFLTRVADLVSRIFQVN